MFLDKQLVVSLQAKLKLIMNLMFFDTFRHGDGSGSVKLLAVSLDDNFSVLEVFLLASGSVVSSSLYILHGGKCHRDR